MKKEKTATVARGLHTKETRSAPDPGGITRSSTTARLASQALRPAKIRSVERQRFKTIATWKAVPPADV